MSVHHEALARAQSPAEVCELMRGRILELMPLSGLNVMSFGSANGDAPYSALYQRGADVEEVRWRLAPALQLLLAEPKLPPLFAQPKRMLRVEQALGWDYWFRSATYQEHFRAMTSARQLVVGLTDAAGTPTGFIAASRAEDEDALDAQQEARLLACRDEAERALAPFAVSPDWNRPVDDILDAITTALPIPALLLAENGRVLWMNREAELRFGAVGFSVRGQRFYATPGGLLAELVSVAMREVRRPGELLGAPQRESSPRWLVPGETLMVRRLTARAAASSVLVCLHASVPRRTEAHPNSLLPSAASLRGFEGMSARETEVAVLAADGFSVVAIAHQLAIAESTVSSHLKRVYRKLGVCSRVELAARLRRSRAR